VLALQPLDVIKTRLQVQDGAGALPVYKGTRDAMRRILREEGWKALYSGERMAAARPLGARCRRWSAECMPGADSR
jgi:solute carrier family 25 folate transporter 32